MMTMHEWFSAARLKSHLAVPCWKIPLIELIDWQAG